jgi:hypothetical protein
MPAMNDGAECAVSGVRKPPRNEPAGYGGLEVLRTLLWGLYERGTVKLHFCALLTFISFVRPEERILSSRP